MGDQAARELEEGFVDVGSAFPANAESSETVEPGEGTLDHLSVGAQAAAIGCAAAGDDGDDPTGPDLVPVDNRPRSVEPGRRVQLGQQHFMQLLPDPGLVPVPHSTPARHAGREAELLGQVFSLDAGVQHEKNPAQHLPVRDRLATRVSEPSLPLR